MIQPLALTMGEPAGIGPDVTLQAWLRRERDDLPSFYVVGDRAFLEARARMLGLAVRFVDAAPDRAHALFSDAVPVLDLGPSVTSQPGRPDRSSAPVAIASIVQSVADVKAGRASALVTNPIAKSVLYQAGFAHPGHTEFLAELAACDGIKPLPVMLLWSPALSVVPVTIHLPLRDAIEALTTDLIIATSRVVASDLAARLGVAKPRLAISGLNPHAGEDATLGTEDRDIIAPAIAALRADGIDARGPLPADTMFHAAARATYDCAICMYHDQALIPAKTLAFDHAVNVTLGLPFIRTSPDHGTAFNIAGTGRADPTSLIAALKLAARMAVRA